LFLNSTTIISGLKNGELNLWDIPSGTRRQTLVGHNDRINALQVHDNVLASGSSDRTGRIWDLNSTQCMCVLDDHGGYVGRLGFNADGSLLAAGAQDGETKIWDVASGTCRATCSGHTKIVTQFSNNSDNQLISCAADGTIRTWDWATGALVDTLQVYEDSDAHKNNALRGLAWSTDYLISGGMNGLLRAWDWRDHQSHIDLRVPNGSVYHLVSKGDLMVIAVNAGGGKHLIEVWDVSTLDLDGEIQRAALSRLSSTSTAQGGA
jgi:WD40 repeat protein